MDEIKILQRTTLPISKLEPNKGQIPGLPKNPRAIREAKYKKLLQSIKDNPEMLSLREIIAVEHKGKYVILGGNMRYRAMKEIGYKEAPCTIVPPGTTVEQMKAFVLKDNSTFGEWDIDDLINEWEAALLSAAAIDISDIKLPGEDEGEQAKEDGFDVTANTPEEPKSHPGDIYQLGRHRLICGDSTDPGTIAALMDGKTADLLLTDPPYNVGIVGGNHALPAAKRRRQGKHTIENDQMEGGAFGEFLHKAFTAAAQHLKAGGAFYCWYSSSEEVNFTTALNGAGLTIRQVLIWVKSTFVLGRQDYQWKHEPIKYGFKEGAAHYFTPRRDLATVIRLAEEIDLNKATKDELREIVKAIKEVPTSILEADRPAKSEDHPIMKPIPLIGEQIKNSTRRGEIVLDPFGGSGTTLIAADQIGRTCYMVEYDPKYIDVIVRRWEEQAGMKANLIGNRYREGAQTPEPEK